ncbi:N-acetylmuramoyl-L-alanine amidase [Guptibacillus algicola]|uniref:N-acetylmuramoyl-L-alanine amidase n=1 Tax=Guptibacillus algicola TaxID=225844 RepID=UPI001CD231DE|nr:N-acetylmuramoyl-L-alanine amidase [Alkalihalobacillus algicola]MCA0989088.1 N-acetylmuramoyl-L-alanine amidase [Alkalihalobacillus algicola]
MIIIDAGHGGIDPGACAKGIKEKDWTLEVSLHQQLFLKKLGVQTILTRSEDKGLTPGNRTNLVKRSGGSICISNHFNAGGGTGAEVIHSIYSDGMLATAAGEALKEAGMPLRRIFSRKGSDNRDYYYMHRLTGTVETIIVEYGFLDSNEDMAKLRTHSFRLKLAESVALSTIKIMKPSRYVVQAGLFKEKSHALKLCNELKAKGYDAFIKQED